MTDPTAALSFGVAAAEYDRFRPRYPEAALRWTGCTPRGWWTSAPAPAS
ncbi:hypothetical protein ACFFKH_27705 [Micromonospora marina]|nr:hypothetical protein [Micromonospora marina]